MRLFPVSVALVLIFGSAVAADDFSPIDPEQPVVIRVYFDDPALVAEIAREKEPWTVNRREGYLLIDATPAEYRALMTKAKRIEIDVKRTAEYLKPMVRSPNQRAGISGFECYRTVEETFATAESIAAENPTLAEWKQIGDSWEQTAGLGGYDLRVLELGNQGIAGVKPKLFVMSAVHSRELATAELMTRFAEYLVDGYGLNADATWLLDTHEVHLLLQANPDGRKQAEAGQFWRKNTNQNYCGAASSNRGADLNRNWEFQWGCCGGSSSSACSEVYRGPGPSSEPEITSIQAYLRSEFTDARPDDLTTGAADDTSGIFIDVHSFGELILWPWGFTSTVAPNGNALQTLGRKLADFSGYFPEQAIGLTVTDGTSDDFAYGDLGIAAFTYEIGTTFFQGCGAFENDILEGNLASLVYAAKAARAPYLLPSGPDTIDVALSASVVPAGAMVSLTARVDDTRFNGANGTEPTQDIGSANAYLDVYPWDAQPADAIAMTAGDGSFDSGDEIVTVELDTTGLSAGRHTVYVVGDDTGGQSGVPAAEFLYVVDPATAPRISGTVVAGDTGDPLAATVSVDPVTTAVTDPGDGSFESLLVSGTYNVSVTPDSADYGPLDLGQFTLADGESVIQNVVLYPFCDVLFDDVESGNGGWTTGGNWGITSQTSFSGSNSWTDSPGGNYSNQSDSALESPVLDLSSYSSVRLEFASLCRTEAGYDYCVVEVYDGSSWVEKARYDGFQGSWGVIAIDANELAGLSNAQVRFRLTSDVSITDDGWYVDDIRVRGSGQQCLAGQPDTDGDGIVDAGDNCTGIANPSQCDRNGDGFGNSCDADLDDSGGVVNFVDLSLFKDAFGTEDAAADLDCSGGPVNFGDLAIFRALFGLPAG